jgi:cell division protein FtsW (lipid II flippase)/cell division protein FtsI/penicillin-binding protein 2
LIAATPILVLLFAMLLVNQSTQITVSSFAVPIALIVGFVIAHLAIRKFAPAADPAILPTVFLLSGIGITFVLRLSPSNASMQIIWLFIGIGLMIATIVLVPSVEKIGNYKYTCLLIGLILLILPMIPGIGAERNGSRLWLSIGGFSFQPGEIAKIFIVLFLAAYLADNRELLSTMRTSRIGLRYPNFRALLPLLFMWVIALLVVIFERDLGSALLLFGIFLAMIYVATGRLSYVIIGLALAAIGAVGLYSIFDHVQTRVSIWLNPWSDPQGGGYQLVQSLYSIADGGLFGTGIGRGMPTLITFVESDFIFSAIAEEMGLLGASAVIFLYIIYGIRGFLVAARAKSDMAAFTAAGLTSTICLQAFVIIGGVTDFIPLTGVTLPFMSQGGSSLLGCFINVGLLISAGNEGTGLTKEMETTGRMMRIGSKGVLGRTALGHRLTILIGLFAILFALLIANLTYIQVVRADEIQNMSSNNHTLAKQEQQERGAIITSDNVVLAESKEQDDGTYKRVYPQKKLAAQLVGYSSQRYGSSGIEKSMNSSLVGSENFATLGDAIRSFAGEKTAGNDVQLTINSKVQKEAEKQLSGEEGACVVLDTKTGAVLAQASSPSYDANKVEDVITGKNKDADLINRATQTLYAPGSTFKTVTLAAALDTDTVTADSTFDGSSPQTIGGGQVTNYRGVSTGTITVREATARSINTVFARIAVKLGAKKLVSYAEKFGFNSDSLAQDFDVTKSLMPDPDEMTTWETAWAGIGQPVGQHSSPSGPQTTVTQMAVVMAAIANDGRAMHPYVVDKVISSSGATVSETSASPIGQVISKSTAKKEQSILRTVVTSGSGAAANISGATVIGKTGTAETENKKSDAWFVGTAKANGKSVTIAILVKRGNSGGEVAAPKAKEILETALEEEGALD